MQTFSSQNGLLETFGYATYGSMGVGHASVTKGLNNVLEMFS